MLLAGDNDNLYTRGTLMDMSKSIPPENILQFPPDAKEEFEITNAELNQIKEAMKDEKFRQLLHEYVEEVRDPNNQLIYQQEMRQLERERGNVVHFINPVSCYVLKTSVDGKKKAFINICSNPLIKKPTFETVTQDKKVGSLCSIPYSQSAGRDDMDKAGKSCSVYDVLFNPEILLMGKLNNVLQQKLEETALDAVEKSFNVALDRNNVRKPKLLYKGMKTASIIKYKIGGQPPDSIDLNELEKELPPEADEVQNYKPKKEVKKPKKKELNIDGVPNFKNVKNMGTKTEEYTVPKHNLKYRSYLDMQDYCIDSQRDGRSSKPIPEEVILTIDLPLLRDSSNLDADILEDGWQFELTSDKNALYKLKIKLPFRVHQDASKAIFDKDERKLCVTMKTYQKASEFIFPPMQPYEDSESEHLESIVGQQIGSLDSVDNLAMGSLSIQDSPQDESPLISQEGSLNSSSCKKSVSFSDIVQRQLYRSNSSILGQRKKNQRKAKNKKRARERLNSGESISSMDEEVGVRPTRERICSGESLSSMDDDTKSCSEDEEEHQ